MVVGPNASSRVLSSIDPSTSFRRLDVRVLWDGELQPQQTIWLHFGCADEGTPKFWAWSPGSLPGTKSLIFEPSQPVQLFARGRLFGDYRSRYRQATFFRSEALQVTDAMTEADLEVVRRPPLRIQLVPETLVAAAPYELNAVLKQGDSVSPSRWFPEGRDQLSVRPYIVPVSEQGVVTFPDRGGLPGEFHPDQLFVALAYRPDGHAGDLWSQVTSSFSRRGRSNLGRRMTLGGQESAAPAVPGVEFLSEAGAGSSASEDRSSRPAFWNVEIDGSTGGPQLVVVPPDALERGRQKIEAPEER